MRRAISATLLVLIAAQLSGCVAIPIVAAGTMLGRDRLKLGKPRATVAKTPKTSRKVRQGGPVVQAAMVTPTTTLPTPQPLDPFYRPFVDYALKQHRIGIAGAERASAVLSASSSLERPDAIKCGTRPSATIVDIDVVPSDSAQTAQLDAALKQLRNGGVHILWVADMTVAGVEGIRQRLWANGGVGDPEDRLLLKRMVDDRKQTLRREAAESYCVVAVVGERKGDVDELYDYLRDPALAYRLDRYWGSGWFIIPQKLVVDLTEKD